MTFHKNQRVMTRFGPGTILAFEVFDGKGWPVPPVDTDPENGYRVLVKLDQSDNWRGGSVAQPHPYIYRRELQALKE